jgi:hypothetical protein
VDDLVQFLRQRLADDLEEIEGYDGSWNDVDGCWGVHIDPARVLAEVEAKRRVMGRHHNFQGWCAGCGNDLTHRISDCPELRDLAAPYADHPEYREEWRPSPPRAARPS